jgi:NADH dehydrogenase FAD-containing subunit
MGVTDDEGYIHVDWNMRVMGHERIYAIGDSVSFAGPKMGHMAVRQGEVAATNLAAEIEGHEPVSHYSHEMRFVIDEIGSDSLYLHKDIWATHRQTWRRFLMKSRTNKLCCSPTLLPRALVAQNLHKSRSATQLLSLRKVRLVCVRQPAQNSWEHR